MRGLWRSVPCFLYCLFLVVAGLFFFPRPFSVSRVYPFSILWVSPCFSCLLALNCVYSFPSCWIFSLFFYHIEMFKMQTDPQREACGSDNFVHPRALSGSRDWTPVGAPGFFLKNAPRKQNHERSRVSPDLAVATSGD